MGLFEFVFGKGAPKDDTAPKQAFYLNDDEAKTFGNIDYMRSTKVVRRTFAKKKGETEHMESVRQISAMDAKEIGGTGYQAPASQPTATFSAFSTPASTPSSASTESKEPAAANDSAPAPEVAPVRRKPASSDMDMFRNMAKDLRS